MATRKRTPSKPSDPAEPAVRTVRLRVPAAKGATADGAKAEPQLVTLRLVLEIDIVFKVSLVGEPRPR